MIWNIKAYFAVYVLFDIVWVRVFYSLPPTTTSTKSVGSR